MLMARWAAFACRFNDDLTESNLRFRPKGATTNQPGATPQESAPQHIPSPNGAAQIQDIRTYETTTTICSALSGLNDRAGSQTQGVALG